MNYQNLTLHRDGHLGGYVPASGDCPHGDPYTYFPRLWEWLIERFAVQSMLDVGCGEGHAVKWFLDHGVEAYGIEGCQAAIDASPVQDVIARRDFTRPMPSVLPELNVSVGLVWACEFVEHVEERFIPNYLTCFQRGRVLAMTHAFPGQVGHHHVNCRPEFYWVDLMTKAGFTLDRAATEQSRQLDAEGHWRRSGLIFVRNEPN